MEKREILFLGKYLPLKKLTKKELKQQFKPWITCGVRLGLPVVYVLDYLWCTSWITCDVRLGLPVVYVLDYLWCAFWITCGVRKSIQRREKL